MKIDHIADIYLKELDKYLCEKYVYEVENYIEIKPVEYAVGKGLV